MARRNSADPQLLALGRLIENIAYDYPTAIDHCYEQLRMLDGYPGGSDEPKVAASSELTAPERVVSQRLWLEQQIEQLRDDHKTLQEIAANMLKRMRDIRGTRVTLGDEPTKLCDRTSRDGALIPWTPWARLEDGNGWSDPTCRNVASRGALCDDCSRREQRWRRHHGLTMRTDGAFSQPGPSDRNVAPNFVP